MFSLSLYAYLQKWQLASRKCIVLGWVAMLILLCARYADYECRPTAYNNDNVAIQVVITTRVAIETSYMHLICDTTDVISRARLATLQYSNMTSACWFLWQLKLNLSAVCGRSFISIYKSAVFVVYV